MLEDDSEDVVPMLEVDPKADGDIRLNVTAETESLALVDEVVRSLEEKAMLLPLLLVEVSPGEVVEEPLACKDEDKKSVERRALESPDPENAEEVEEVGLSDNCGGSTDDGVLFDTAELAVMREDDVEVAEKKGNEVLLVDCVLCVGSVDGEIGVLLEIPDSEDELLLDTAELAVLSEEDVVIAEEEDDRVLLVNSVVSVVCVDEATRVLLLASVDLLASADELDDCQDAEELELRDVLVDGELDVVSADEDGLCEDEVVIEVLPLDVAGEESNRELLEGWMAGVALLPAGAALEEVDEGRLPLLQDEPVVEMPELRILLSLVAVVATTEDEIVGGVLDPLSELVFCVLDASLAVLVASTTLSLL